MTNPSADAARGAPTAPRKATPAARASRRDDTFGAASTEVVEVVEEVVEEVAELVQGVALSGRLLLYAPTVDSSAASAAKAIVVAVTPGIVLLALAPLTGP